MEACRSKFEKGDQSHVFKYLDAGMLTTVEEMRLMKQLNDIDVERVNSIFKESTNAINNATENFELEPLEGVDSTITSSPEDIAQWEGVGMQAIYEGKVAIILMAGGQGTRLGFDKPKGMYDIGLPSGKTLFHLQASRIIALKKRVARLYEVLDYHQVKLPWYIMTSPMTDMDTRDYFKTMSYFGLPDADVFFFQQGLLPCTTTTGRFIMKSKSEVATAPDGNGGIYMGLHKCGAISDMVTRGVKGVFVYSVDNAVVRVADPVFLGYCMGKNADVGSKVVTKAHAGEKVGVLAKRNGKYSVVEYSEMSSTQAAQTNADGSLTYSAGNVCIHYYGLDFLKDTCSPDNLSKVYHFASKKIPYADEVTGNTIEAKDIKENTGVKLESFIFDVFESSKRMAALEVPRGSEFSPVKNAPGSPFDSPTTARDLISHLHEEWLVSGGVIVKDSSSSSGSSGSNSNSSIVVVSPTVTYGYVSDIKNSLLAGTTVLKPCYITTADDKLLKDLEVTFVSDDDDSSSTGSGVGSVTTKEGLHIYVLPDY